MQIHRVVILLSLVAACSSNAATSTTTSGDGASTSSVPETSVSDTGAGSTTPSSAPPSSGTPTSAGFTCLRTPSSWDDNVRLGDCDTSGYVHTIEDRLNVLGFPCTADNQFRADTDTAVRNFQASRGLSVDGQVGVNTWAALTEGGIGD